LAHAETLALDPLMGSRPLIEAGLAHYPMGKQPNWIEIVDLK
jgi:hypothetical protein